MADCVDLDHFDIVTEEGNVSRIVPQPWMQWRPVAEASADSVGGQFMVSGGGNKNILLQDVTAAWTNNSPIDQQVYGLVTTGGSTVILQARSRGGLVILSTMWVGPTPEDLSFSDTFGVGADNGLGGILALGIGFCIADGRVNRRTIPLAPERTGWLTVGHDGGTVTGRCQVWFSSEQWESGVIDGGDSECESSFVTGDLTVNLFAVPVIT